MRTLIDHLMRSVHSGSVSRRNLLINEVPHGLPLATDENFLALVLGNLLNDVVNHTENDYIRIGASDSGTLTIRMSNNTIAYDKTFTARLATTQVILQGMGGLINVRDEDKEGTLLEVKLDRNFKAA